MGAASLGQPTSHLPSRHRTHREREPLSLASPSGLTDRCSLSVALQAPASALPDAPAPAIGEVEPAPAPADAEEDELAALEAEMAQ